jgi:hypothetical protein
MHAMSSPLARLVGYLAVGTLVAAPLAAQGPTPDARAADAPRPYRLGLDLLAGAWLPRFEESRVANTTAVSPQSHAGGALAARLRLPIGHSPWSLLVGASFARVGDAFTSSAASFPQAFPERGYRLQYRDVTAGVERAWRLSGRSALLTAIEGGIGWYESRETSCRAVAPLPAAACAGPSGGLSLRDWGPTLIPSLGVQHQVSRNAALTVLVRPALLNADNLFRWSGQQSPASIVAGVRLGPSPLRSR